MKNVVQAQDLTIGEVVYAGRTMKVINDVIIDHANGSVHVIIDHNDDSPLIYRLTDTVEVYDESFEEEEIHNHSKKHRPAEEN